MGLKNRTNSDRKFRNQKGSTEGKKPEIKDIDFEYRVEDASQAAIFARPTEATATHTRKTHTFAADTAITLKQKQDFNTKALKPKLTVSKLLSKTEEMP